jgi:flagellar hook-basal body complex protein FliE
LSAIRAIQDRLPIEPSNGAVQKTGTSFQEILKNSLSEVNNLMEESGTLVDYMASGEIADVHQVMIALEKADIGLELAMEVRNKLLDSYREFMRMQI